MIECKRCGSTRIVKSGTVRETQRYLCKQCGYHFVEGDQRENSTAIVLKALCTIFQAMGISKQYEMIHNYLKRDPSLIHRWMNGSPHKFNRRGKTEALEFTRLRPLVKELQDDGLKDGDSTLMVDNIIDDLYIAVILQRREKR